MSEAAAARRYRIIFRSDGRLEIVDWAALGSPALARRSRESRAREAIEEPVFA